jgi:hypothetical protein
VTTDEQHDPIASDEPLSWTLRVSVDGAQRLIHAWKDGRLEQTLGFPIAALQIHTPFTPTPGGGSGPPPEEDSRPITLLPWDGLTITGIPVPQGGAPAGGSAAPQGAAAGIAVAQAIPSAVIGGASAAPRSGIGTKKKVAVALGLVIAALVAAWLTRSSPSEPPPEAASSPEAEHSTAERSRSIELPDDPPATAADSGVTDSAVVPSEGSEGSTADPTTAVPDPIIGEGTDPVPDATAPAAIEPAVVPDASTPRKGEGDQPQPAPAEGVASDGKTGPAKPRKGGSGGKSASKESTEPKPGEPKPGEPKPGEPKLYSRYQCATEGAEFAIVVHGRSQAEAKANACGGSLGDGPAIDACIQTTSCERAK